MHQLRLNVLLDKGENNMFELLALLLECRSNGTLPADLARRVDTVVRDTLAQCDALLGWQDELERLDV